MDVRQLPPKAFFVSDTLSGNGCLQQHPYHLQSNHFDCRDVARQSPIIIFLLLLDTAVQYMRGLRACPWCVREVWYMWKRGKKFCTIAWLTI